ncbi:DUF4097 family beta strand repeat-containing protein [Streptomyces sp. NBC_01016]|uniref:DUF4097 family beta strand repeat-containing protein n=1 Tax=Streptomyces sp. NBC_01016 TaxID=2903720 RepID=UPI002251480F|nr:DUF4097 family beta strand repeat-containing protein [Streptomyces sp. NBC_01016]MCX4828737.1 DUF4097 family beta strand repeat-containing protein [Streptomyces sp. NBC_01016]
MTERTIAVDNFGPIALDLTMNAGSIRLAVDPTLKQARIVLNTEATSGPSADAIRNTAIRQSGQRVTVRVPDVEGSGAGQTTIQVGGNTMTFSGGNGVSFVGGNVYVSGNRGGRVFINGREVTANSAGDTSAPTPIEATVYLPARSEAQISTHSADTVVTGELARLDYDGYSGTVTAERVGDLDAGMTSGSLRIGEVTGTLAANLTSGNFTVGAYSGHDARLAMTSGNVRVGATSQSSGRLAVSVTSGNAVVTGAGHLNVRRRVTSGNLHIS